jgi:hypothetical protein
MFFAVVLSFTACAHTPPSKGGRANVAAVRVEIRAAIGGERSIVSMGKVTETEAEVYTQTSNGRRQEMWKRVDGAWKLQESHDVASAQ